MDVFDVFEKENHLKPDFDKKKFSVLKGWDLGWELLEPINIAQSPDDDKELSKRFSEGQKALYFFWYLDAQVINGGFFQFYWNGFRNYLPTIKKGLSLIGDNALIDLIDLADKYYTSNQSQFQTLWKSGDYSAANEVLPEFDTYDDIYYQIHDNTMECLETYARNFPDEFVNFK